MIITLVIGRILGLILISSRFDYYRIERNEIVNKKGIFK